MKNLFAMIALGAMVTGVSYAQTSIPKKDRKPRTERTAQQHEKVQKLTPEQRAEKKAEKLAEKYQLSASQKVQLKELHQKHRSEKAAMRPHRGQGTEVTAQQRAEMQEKHAQFENELKAILTPAQYAQYQADRSAKGNGEHRGKKKGYSNKMSQKNKNS